MIRSRIENLKNWHGDFFSADFWQPIKAQPSTIFLFAFAVFIASALNWYVRDWQYQIWEKDQNTFYFEESSKTFTTADAPYFLGLAKALKNGESQYDYEKLRLHPGNPPWIDRYKSAPPSPPLLATIISEISENGSEASLLTSANSLIPITAALTALMVAFAFGSMGFWLEGAIAAAGSGLSFAFISRSGAGRIDTDQLNLGFFYLVIGLVILASRSKNLLNACFWSALCGLVYYVFDLWYSKPFFGWAFFSALIWLTFITTTDLKRVVLQGLIFLLISGLWFQGIGISFENAYLVSTFDINNYVFPNVLETITETRKISIVEILERISGSLYVAIPSILGLAAWCLRHPGLAVVFAPALGFFFLNFVIGNRAIFYSAPLFWFGFGWLVLMTSKILVSYLQVCRLKPLIHFSATLAAFLLVWFVSPTKYIQAPTFDSQTVQLFDKLPGLVNEEEFVVATWWDYGYLSMFLNGQPTLHDGGIQTTPATYFVAEALLANKQDAAAKRLRELAHFGADGIIDHNARSTGKLLDTAKKPIFLVLTRDMANWMPSISLIGNWDIKTGQRKPPRGMNVDYTLSYQKLKCVASHSSSKPICNGQQFDLENGDIGQNRILEGIAMAKNGFQIGGRGFQDPTLPFVLHSDTGDRGGQTLLMHKDLYFSVFHQLFFLGRAEKDSFELVYDGFPHARVYLVN